MSNSISVAEAEGFSRPVVSGEYVLNQRPTDQFSQLLRLRAVGGHQVRVNEADASSLADYASTIATTGVAVSATLPSFSARVGKIAHFAAILEIDSAIAPRYGTAGNILKELLQLKVAAAIDRWRTMLITGDSANAGEFDGLEQLATDAGLTETVIGNPTSGVPIAGDVERILGSVDPQGSLEGRFLVMNQNAFTTLWSSPYANQIAWMRHPVVGHTQMVSGVPVLIDNFIPNDIPTANKTAIFAVLLSGSVRLEGIYPTANAGSEIRVDGPYQVEAQDTLSYGVNLTMGLAAYGQPVAMLEGVNA